MLGYDCAEIRSKNEQEKKVAKWAKEYIIKYNLNSICNILMSPSSGEMDIRVLAEKMLQDHLQVRLQTQLHKVIWDNERGR